MTVEYEFYTDTYKGSSIAETDWSDYCARAAAQLERYKRIYTVTEPEANAEAKAICAMADAMYSFDLAANGDGGPLASASIGSVSVSYGGFAGTAIDISAKGQAKELLRCARLYLDIYRGIL